MDARGNALVAWLGDGSGMVRSLRRPAGGEFGGAQALGAGGRRTADSLAPQLAVTPSGRAVLAWYDRRKGATADSVGAEAAIGSTAAGFGAARQLSTAPADGLSAALDSRTTAVTWVRRPGSQGRAMGAFGRTGRPVRTLRTRVLSRARIDAGFTHLAVARGRATVTWDRRVRVTRDGRGIGVIEARTVARGGNALTPVQTVSEEGACCEALALSRRGRPYLTWYGTGNSIGVTRADLVTGRFATPTVIRTRGFDELDLIPSRGDSMLLAFRRQAYHLLAYGE
jgi:hypothetical protein